MATKEEKWITVSAKTDGAVWDRENPIEGELIRAQENVGPNASWLYTLLTEKGEIGVWGSTVLDSRLQELSVGDQVRIEPLGKVKSPKTGREYMDYLVQYKPGTKSGYEKAKEISDDIKADKARDVIAEDIGDELISFDEVPF